jgi:hypothetical protein
MDSFFKFVVHQSLAITGGFAEFHWQVEVTVFNVWLLGRDELESHCTCRELRILCLKVWDAWAG